MTISEKVAKLTARIERWDNQIAEATTAREQAVSEIVALLGSTTSYGAKYSATAKVPKEKLGDRIVAVLSAAGSMTRDQIVAKLKTEAQKASLALYHLTTRGDVYERDGYFFLTTAAKSSVADTSVSNDEQAED